MNIARLGCLLPLLLAGCASIAEPETQGWRPLFDGRSLAGWTPKISGHALGEDPYGTFRAEDGVIRVTYEGYDGFKGRFGHLVHERPASAFRIRF
ncbi:MAG: family 16 glycoside hydrolase, partial [Brevundimonas sp.]